MSLLVRLKIYIVISVHKNLTKIDECNYSDEGK